jgi:hypothetical protein
MFSVGHGMLSFARFWLHVFGCMSHVSCCTVHVARCMLDVQAEQLENVFQLIDCMTVPAHAVAHPE